MRKYKIYKPEEIDKRSMPPGNLKGLLDEFFLRELLISFVVMTEFGKDDEVFFDFEHKNKTADVNALIVFEVSSKIFKMLKGGEVEKSDLIDFLLNGFKQSGIFLFKFYKSFFDQSDIYVHELNKSLNSFKVFGLSLPEDRSLEIFSVESTTSVMTDFFTSLKSSSEISESSLIFFNSLSFLRSFSVSENARLATEDQLIKSVSSISCFNSSGRDRVIAFIFCLYVYYLYTKDIFKSFGGEIFSGKIEKWGLVYEI